MDGVFMKIRIFVWGLLVFFVAYALFALESVAVQRSLAEKTVRLHVVANSDSEADQAQKLRVRDAVLQTVGDLTADCQSADEARSVISESLEQIEAAAEETLCREGCDRPVRATLGIEPFATRYYDTFTLPAGQYPALRVTIGEGRGRNWWCVVFPSLCVAATSDTVEEYAEAGGFDPAEADLITGGEEKYELRFKTLDWVQRFLNWFE